MTRDLVDSPRAWARHISRADMPLGVVVLSEGSDDILQGASRDIASTTTKFVISLFPAPHTKGPRIPEPDASVMLYANSGPRINGGLPYQARGPSSVSSIR
jgi:hypothetical protein